MSRKKKNLEFIRVKNNLRRGIVSFYVFTKISIDMEIDTNFIQLANDRAIKSLKKNYKIDFDKYSNPIIDRLVGSEGDDFIQNLATLEIKINLVGRLKR
jgi:hypothetical protein